MTQHFLDGSNIRPVIQHERGGGVPEQMAGTLLPHIRPSDISLYQTGESHKAECAAPVGQEQRSIIKRPYQPSP